MRNWREIRAELAARRAARPFEIVPHVRTECHDAPVVRRYHFGNDCYLMVCVRCGADAGSPSPEDVGRLFVDAYLAATEVPRG